MNLSKQEMMATMKANARKHYAAYKKNKEQSANCMLNIVLLSKEDYKESFNVSEEERDRLVEIYKEELEFSEAQAEILLNKVTTLLKRIRKLAAEM